MANYKIKCEVVDIKNNLYGCSQIGDTFIFRSRTPDGMCAKAFATVYPIALAMRFSESIGWEDEHGMVDITCPDQDVVYRLSRVKKLNRLSPIGKGQVDAYEQDSSTKLGSCWPRKNS